MNVKSKLGNIPLIFAIISAVIGLSVIICSGSPYDLIHKIKLDDLLPPIWIWCLSSLILNFLTGYALGCIMSSVASKRLCGEKEIRAYQGIIFFIGSIFLSLAHYPTFFVAEKLVIALILSVVSIMLSLICFILWTKVSFISSIIMATFTLWGGYVAYVNLRVLLSI